MTIRDDYRSSGEITIKQVTADQWEWYQGNKGLYPLLTEAKVEIVPAEITPPHGRHDPLYPSPLEDGTIETRNITLSWFQGRGFRSLGQFLNAFPDSTVA